MLTRYSLLLACVSMQVQMLKDKLGLLNPWESKAMETRKEEAAAYAADAIEDLFTQLGLPTKLNEVGVYQDGIARSQRTL
ncbi:MAG: hypothetical protein Ct9H300mP11_29890 [Chloroflexota bacterium]|nr:MAG: hypothetical protein Ct9H300mP11_29890 [Chloroflexota bacterium]